jgi:hypothetical protein
MEINDQLEVEHLLFFDRRCRVCGKIKNLIEDYYLSRKNRKTLPSSYSYECKECTIIRIKKNKKTLTNWNWEYPDW